MHVILFLHKESEIEWNNINIICIFSKLKKKKYVDFLKKYDVYIIIIV